VHIANATQWNGFPLLNGTAGTEVELDDGSTAGQLTYHIGAHADDVITIDLPDFGDLGPITSDITGDVENGEFNHIRDADMAKEVLNSLDAVMDKVNGARANMGAVMNRLQYVIDNLTNVSTNTEASRSRIQDADYAEASTAMARSQIMQQASTAVLAQANQSLQTVLKLLQG